MGISLARRSVAWVVAIARASAVRTRQRLFRVSPKQAPPENPHFGQIRSGRVGTAVLERWLQRALALQLLANSDRLPKGGCALKRLSEDFRICHGRGRLDQSVARCTFLSTSYRPAAARRALAKAKSRHPRSAGDHAARLRLPPTSRLSHRALRSSADRPRSVASWRRHAGDRGGLCQNSTLAH
jgi:hypothetical protein